MISLLPPPRTSALRLSEPNALPVDAIKLHRFQYCCHQLRLCPHQFCFLILFLSWCLSFLAHRQIFPSKISVLEDCFPNPQ